MGHGITEIRQCSIVASCRLLFGNSLAIVLYLSKKIN